MSAQLELLPRTAPTIRSATLRLDQLTGFEHAQPRAELIELIRRLGRLLQPIVVVAARDGMHSIEEGRRRAKAIAMLAAEGEWPSPAVVDAVIVSGAGTNRRAIRAALALALHATRSDSPASELAAIEAILQTAGAENEDLTVREIGLQTGMSQQTVRRRLRLRRLVPALRTAFDRGEITTGVAEAAARLAERQQSALAQRLLDGERLTAPAVREVTRTQTRVAVDALPGGLFGEQTTQWQATVVGHLTAALQAVPTAANDEELARTINKALSVVQR
jgi:ParB-like chromosome segregation protein Spo0J